MRVRPGVRWEAFFDAVAIATVIVEVLRGASPTALALLGAGAVLVAVRRRFPLAAAVGAILLSALAMLEPDSAVSVWVLAEICLFSVPLRRSGWTAAVAAAVHAVVLYAGALIAFDVGPLDPFALILPVWTGAVVSFGAAIRSQRDYVEAVEQRAASAAAARESEVRHRMDEERLRIARDLHDSVANSIAVISIQAGAAEQRLEADPKAASEALRGVRAASRHVLAEVQEILAVLRKDETAEQERDFPSAASIPQLVRAFATAGTSVTAHLAELPPLEPTVDAALFRVAQEALTNAHRHGSGGAAVRIECDDHRVRLVVENPLAPEKRAEAETGFGLIGMRERVELAGGSLLIAPGGSNFTVVAEFPCDTEKESDA
ncbi:sensor histidine kinase [Glycomyces sp. MUSA5-2]|uniref:sensor histidine kinase n=1 Tax=Glycomyces sp. MUSA5-2 TaxID=2053002 RepID=UPI0030084C66